MYFDSQGSPDLKQQVLKIHQLFYANPLFNEIDHLVGIIPQPIYSSLSDQQCLFHPAITPQQDHRLQLQFALADRCLLITQKSFDKFYKYLSHQLSHQYSQTTQQNKQITKYSLQCADILVTMNGENQKVWNIKKSLLREGKLGLGDYGKQFMINQGVLMKFKKSMVCYQYRLELVEAYIWAKVDTHKVNDTKQQCLDEIKQLIQHEQKLIKKILQRFHRNYFCWMYRLKLLKLLYHTIFPKLLTQNYLQHPHPCILKIYESQINQTHELIQNNPNDHSALHYLNWLRSQANPIEFKMLEFLEKQAEFICQFGRVRANQLQYEWSRGILEFCGAAYESQESYHLLLAYNAKLHADISNGK